MSAITLNMYVMYMCVHINVSTWLIRYFGDIILLSAMS